MIINKKMKIENKFTIILNKTYKNKIKINLSNLTKSKITMRFFRINL